MVGINGWEFVLLIVLAVVILGPERLPEYAAKLAHAIRRLRVLAEGAKDQLKDQLGPEYQDINWRQYDPRQYDPRRIVREALAEPIESFRELTDLSDLTSTRSAGEEPDPVAEEAAPEHVPSPWEWDPARPTPYDVDAT